MIVYLPLRTGGHVLAAPDSCTLCGVVRREHGQRGHDKHAPGDAPAGYVAPDNTIRAARMRARRVEAAVAGMGL